MLVSFLKVIQFIVYIYVVKVGRWVSIKKGRTSALLQEKDLERSILKPNGYYVLTMHEWFSC